MSMRESMNKQEYGIEIWKATRKRYKKQNRRYNGV